VPHDRTLSSPGTHHPPPADLAARHLPIRDLDVSWYRIHRKALGALHFGRSATNRFDAPDGSFGVLYLGRDVHACFVETMGWATGIRHLELGDLAGRALAQIDASRALRLVDLAGRGLARLGADARLASADYAASQAWALALHDHPAGADGIYYRARHDPTRFCAAIFERAAGLLTETSLGALTDGTNRLLLARLLETYDFAVIDPRDD
jgi:hypothetical protein